MMMDARNMQRREINKYIKQNCELSWICLRDGLTISEQKQKKNMAYKGRDPVTNKIVINKKII